MHTTSTTRRHAGLVLRTGIMALALVAAAALVPAPTDHGHPGPGDTPPIALGAYVQPAPVPGDPNAAIAALDASLGRHLAIYQTFTDWVTSTGAPTPFPVDFARYVAGLGATPMITWQPQAPPVPGVPDADQPEFSLAQIESGRYDAYIRSWADQAKTFPGVVYVRLMHEMNGAWYPWGAGVNGNTPAQYVSAWQHVVALVGDEGATNLRFVWCASSSARLDPTPFYPGDGSVSWIALDGYNKGATWKTFTQAVTPCYDEITALSSLPVMIAETASVESPTDPGAKAAWITSAFGVEIPQTFPRVRVALYFDAPSGAAHQALTSSPQALQAFVQVAASPLYQGPPPS